jgi:uncharacterized membrane protein YbjE (DUF340 family)
MFDWVFAFVHLALLLGLLGYAFLAFARGQVLRFLTILLFLAGYYLLVLHKGVKKEIARRKGLKKS